MVSKFAGEPDMRHVMEQRSEIMWTIASLVPATVLMARIFGSKRISLDLWTMLLTILMVCCLLIAFRKMRAVGPYEPSGRAGASANRSSRALSPSGKACSVYLEAVADPPHFIRRVKERVSPLSRAYMVNTHYEITLPANVNPQGAGVVYFPLLVTKKGTLRDDLRFTVNGVPHPSITFDESVSLFEAACASLLAGTQLRRRWIRSTFQTEDFTGLAVSLVNSRVTGTKSVQTVAWNQRAALAQQLRNYLHTSRLKPDEQNLLGTVLTKLANHYVVCVPLEAHGKAGGRWVVEVEERVLPTAEQFGPADIPRTSLERFLSWAVGRAQRLYGLKSGRIEYFPEKAFDCSSYHLEVMGAPGTFLMRQDLYPEAQVVGYWRFRKRQGQRYGHFYSRDLRQSVGPQPSMADPRVLFRFRERTPGYYAPAAVSSVVALLFLGVAWPMAFAVDGRGTDVMALLIAAPGALIGWSGVDQRLNHVGISTAPRVIASLTAIVSLLGAAQFILQRYRPIIPVIQPFGGPLILDADAAWAAILTSAGLLACAGVYAWLRAGVKESRIIRSAEMGL